MTETQTSDSAGDGQLHKRGSQTFLACQVLESTECTVVQHTASSDPPTQKHMGQFTDRSKRTGCLPPPSPDRATL